MAEQETLTGKFLKTVLGKGEEQNSFNEIKNEKVEDIFNSLEVSNEPTNHKRDIIIKGASKNNLRNIDVIIPNNKMTVITGVSGSGKTSLAFDTIFAEGQRKYIESLSSYAPVRETKPPHYLEIF